MLFNRRFWFPVLAAGLVFCATQARADATEDYELGFKRFQQGDMVGAMTELRKASNAGHLKAMVLLAEILDRSEFDEDAIDLYKKAAAQNDPDAMFGLGGMLAAGEGVPAKQPLEGRKWIQKAAEMGHTQSIRVMALAYLNLQLGFVEADRKSPEALRWVTEAAAKDHAPSLDALAEAYRTGSILGVQPDPARAEEYLAKANKVRGVAEPVKGKKKSKKVAATQAAE